MITPRTTADLPTGPPAPHLIQWLMRDKGSALVFGRTGLGKTRLLWQMACAWAQGMSIFTLTPREALRITFIEADMFAEDFEEMIKELRRAGVEPPAGLAWFARSEEENFTVDNAQFFESVSSFNRNHGVHLTIYDAIPDMHGGDPNDARVAHDVLRQLSRLAGRRAWIGVMTQRKADRKSVPDDDTIPALEDMLGTQGWGRQASSILQLTSAPSLVWAKSRLCRRPHSIQLLLTHDGVFEDKRAELTKLVCREAAKGYRSARELAARLAKLGIDEVADRTLRAYISDLEERGVIARL